MERDLSTGQTAQITDGTLGTERGDLSGGQIGDPRFNVGRGHENTKSGGRVRSRGQNEAENEVSPLLGRKNGHFWVVIPRETALARAPRRRERDPRSGFGWEAAFRAAVERNRCSMKRNRAGKREV